MEENVNVNEEVEISTDVNAAENAESKEIAKTYTEEEFQAELSKQKEEIQKSFNEKIAEEVQKELAKSKMTREEKEKAELEEEKAKLDKEKADFIREKITLVVEKELAQNGLSLELKDFLIAETIEKSIENVQKLKLAIDNEVQKIVSEKIKGTTPKASNGAAMSITQEEFNKMSYSQKVELFETNRELYNQLIGGR